MRILIVFVLSIALLGCASMKVHNRTDMFIDIEVRRENVWIGCSDTDLKEENSLMTLYVLDKDVTHEFMFRRVLSVNRCLNIEIEYRQLIDKVPTVRLVGIHPTKSSGNLVTARVPKKFKKSKHKTINWTFIRFSTLKGCESYFIGDCKPENYWGGISPPKKSNLVPSP